MALRTDIFTHADDTLEEWNPSDNGYEWKPTNFARFIALAHPADVLKVIADDVYRHLVFWEDIDAIKDGRYMDHLDTWLAREYNQAPPLWKSLMEAAIKEKQVWDDNSYSVYVRPSLWLLRIDWMAFQNLTFVADKIPSLTFRDEDNTENHLIYLKTAPIETLAELIQNGNIDDEDIPDDKYEAIRGGVRQK
jgi:hypothetical protein